MSEILKQRRFFTKRCFELTDQSLKIAVSKPFSYFEAEFSFEELGRKTSKKKSFNRFLLYASIFCIIALLITAINAANGHSQVDDVTFYIIPTVIFIILLWITYKNTVNLILHNKRHIVFYCNYPDKDSVVAFIEKVLSSQKSFLLNKYAKKEPFISNEKLMEQLIWLKARYIIDDAEFEKLKIDLFPDAPYPTIGFTFNSSAN